MSKDEAIKEFELNDYKYEGFYDDGDGFKMYHFTRDDIDLLFSYSLKYLKKHARHMKMGTNTYCTRV